MTEYVTDLLEQKEILLIAIVWIGFTLYSEIEQHKKIIYDIGKVEEAEGSDGSKYYPRFELTQTG